MMTQPNADLHIQTPDLRRALRLLRATSGDSTAGGVRRVRLSKSPAGVLFQNVGEGPWTSVSIPCSGGAAVDVLITLRSFTQLAKVFDELSRDDKKSQNLSPSYYLKVSDGESLEIYRDQFHLRLAMVPGALSTYFDAGDCLRSAKSVGLYDAKSFRQILSFCGHFTPGHGNNMDNVMSVGIDGNARSAGKNAFASASAATPLPVLAMTGSDLEVVGRWLAATRSNTVELLLHSDPFVNIIGFRDPDSGDWLAVPNDPRTCLLPDASQDVGTAAMRWVAGPGWRQRIKLVARLAARDGRRVVTIKPIPPTAVGYTGELELRGVPADTRVSDKVRMEQCPLGVASPFNMSALDLRDAVTHLRGERLEIVHDPATQVVRLSTVNPRNITLTCHFKTESAGSV